VTLQFGLLGPLAVWSDGDVIEVRGAKRRGLLAYLLVHAGEPQPLDRIVDALWAGSPSRGADATIRTYISQLRKLLGSDVVQLALRPGGYALEFEPRALDSAQFEAAVAGATALPEPNPRLALLDEALSLWRGAPLDEFAGQQWADDRGRQWTRLHVLAHQMRAGALLDTARHRDALPALEQLVAVYPLHEPFWAQLIVARYRCGQQADALAAAREARHVLAQELGIDPGPELVDLESKVLAHDPSLEAPRFETHSDEAAHVTTVIDALPDGVVSFVLTDIEGSSELWDLHPEYMAKALVRHEDLIHEVVHANHGRLLKSRGEGDATLSVFAKATDALTASVSLQRRLEHEVWPGDLSLRARVAVHTGEAQTRGGDYFGGTLNRAARIRGLAAGGQVLISRATHDLVVDVLPADLGLVTVGDDPMKGLRRQEAVFAVHGPGLAAAESVGRSADLPQPSDAGLIGRGDALARVEAALMQPGLVTITGPGGIGKTRLLHAVCAQLHDQFSRVWNIELVAARDLATIESALQDALLPIASDTIQLPQQSEPTSLVAQLASTLGSRRTLLALDNCEQLLDYLPQLLAPLLARSPGLSVLATSRQPLALSGERVIRLLPLELPTAEADRTPDRLAEVESVRLLLDRARDAGADLRLTAANGATIAQICRDLDGIPLALELAAARLATTSPADLLARLSGRHDVLKASGGDPRHRTLHDAIDWSYQLLEPSEQMLLRRLAVFVGGFTLDAAEAIGTEVDADLLTSADDVYLNLAQLVSKSLVVFERDRGRYRLLEPIRQFARARLEASDEIDLVSRRHAAWALQVSNDIVIAQARGSAFEVSLAELDNVHAALDWLYNHGDHVTYMRIVAASGYTWFQAKWRRGRAATELAVNMSESARPRLRAAVILAHGMVEQRASHPASIPWLEQARSMYRELADTAGQAWATFFLARAVILADLQRGTALFEETITLFRIVELPFGEVSCLNNLADAAHDVGDVDAAEQLLERALAVADANDLVAVKGSLLADLGFHAVVRDELTAGRTLLREGVELHRSYGDRFSLIGLLSQNAWGEFRANDLDAAQSLLSEAIRTALDIEDDSQLREAMLVLAAVHLQLEDPEGARAIVAATGWDVDPPTFATTRRSLTAIALDFLSPICADGYVGAAREGRRLGAIAMANEFLAARTLSA